MTTGDLRNRVPVAEADIGTTFITAVELVVEEAKLRFGRNTTTPNLSIDRQVIARSDDRPVAGDLHRYRPV